MDFTTALKCSDLMEKRDIIITMRQKATEGEMRGWSLAIDDNKMPIPAEVKPFFREAIGNALQYYNSEIKKL